ncbi:MAG: TSUP family transporter [Acidimicrobiales bacterium]
MAVGVTAGSLSGLLGVGGGVVLVPGFLLAGLAVKQAIATSLVCVGAFAVPGTVTHGLIGNVDWRVAAFLTLTVVPGARLGAALTMRASDRRLRVTVSAFLGAVAVVYATGELVALVG